MSLTLRQQAAIAIMAGARFTPDGASESVACATPARMMSAKDQAEHAVGLADALIAELEATNSAALDLRMADDDPASALADYVCRAIQDNPFTRTECAGVLQKAVIAALRPTVKEWRKDSERLDNLIHFMNHDGMTVEDLFEDAFDEASAGDSDVQDPEVNVLRMAVRAAIDKNAFRVAQP